MCSFINNPDATDDEVLLEIANALNVYFNYTGDDTCFNASETATGDSSTVGWDYQVCLCYRLNPSVRNTWK